MFVCPQCQFENSETNNFCQRCGTSLTHKSCHECGATVSFGDENCSTCQAQVGILWWAVVCHNSSVASPKEGQYLDEHQRYRCKQVKVFKSTEEETWLHCQVLDTQPLKKASLREQLDHLSEEEIVNLQDVETSLVNQLHIPEIAVPYLNVQEELSFTVPSIHDTWRCEGLSAIIVEDRSQWQSLMNLWETEVLHEIQRLHYLDKIAGLWEVFARENCCQSLLELDNLIVDEDQALCLQQLYMDAADSPYPPDISQLAKVWEKLFSGKLNTRDDLVDMLMGQLAQGEINTVQDLRAHIQNLPSHHEEEEMDSDEQTFADKPFGNLPVAIDLARIQALSEEDEDEEEEDTPEDLEPDELPTVVLPLQLLSIHDAACTDIGTQRQHNEDFFGYETQVKKVETTKATKISARGIYIVCDGMGGHAAGEVASAMATESLQKYLQNNWKEGEMADRDLIKEGILVANRTLYSINMQKGSSGSDRMGTTLVMVLVQDTRVAIAHVGDSRVYRITRKGGLEQLTLDHEVGQQEILHGVDPDVAYARPDAYQLTQALGPRDNNLLKPEVNFMDIKEDTLLLLCSDGLCDNNFLETHGLEHLAPMLSSKTNLEHGVRKLVEVANQHNGHDNITALIIRLKVQPNLEQKALF